MHNFKIERAYMAVCRQMPVHENHAMAFARPASSVHEEKLRAGMI